MKKVRLAALLAGLAVDLVGTTVFAIVLGVVAVVLYHRRAEKWEIVIQHLMNDVPLLLVSYLGGIAFTFLGAYVTARMSKPNSVLNTFVLGVISSLAGFFFLSMNPVWYTVLCFVTVLPVSLVPGYLVQRRVTAGSAE